MALDWSRVSASHVQQACNLIDTGTSVPKRSARNTFLILNGRHYPGKYVRGLAYELATGVRLGSDDYAGGQETIQFFRSLGFETGYTAVSTPGSEAAITPVPTPPSGGTPRAQKDALRSLLVKRFGTTACEAKFPWLQVPAVPEMGRNIARLYHALGKSRGQWDFITPGYFLCCDYCIPSQKLLIEYDESQHFTAQRAIALRLYPPKLPLGFDVGEWIATCQSIAAVDRDPPHRDEQRAFYDSLRDLLAHDNDFVVIRIRHGKYDWTGSQAERSLDQLLASYAPSSDVEQFQASAAQIYAEPPVGRIALISHNYGIRNSAGLWDYSDHFDQVNEICDEQRCDTILYALYTWDTRSTVPKNHATVFSNLQHVQRIVLETGDFSKNGGNPGLESLSVETWLRTRPLPVVFRQIFARSGQAAGSTPKLIEQLPSRQIGNSALIICGETNAVSLTRPSGKIYDPHGLHRALADSGVAVILNPIHDYMRRYEMRGKRRYFSRGGRFVISVWNRGRGRESSLPWTIFHDEVEKTTEVHEIPNPIGERPDLRIGIFSLPEPPPHRGEEIDLTAEDHAILDQVWAKIAAKKRGEQIDALDDSDDS